MGLFRKVIRIRAEDSPNVRYALEEIRCGKTPSNTIVLEGVLSWADYQKRLATWDAVRKCVGLDGMFYEGAEVLLYPPEWLNRAEKIADRLRGVLRHGEAIGVDCGEGGDDTCMSVVDRRGLIELVSKSTPDTSVIEGDVLAFAQKHRVRPERIYFDRGGGGKQIADRMRKSGYQVATVAFGEAVTPRPRYGRAGIKERVEQKEERYTYKTRRAQMYGILRELLDPTSGGEGFAIPAEYTELRRQLGPIPLLYDPEGRLEMLPKSRRDAATGTRTLKDLLGCSPDEADSLVLAVYGMICGQGKVLAGAAV